MIGQQLLHYQIVEKLGEGGMGVVYRARDTHLDRFVAIKVLPPEKVADPRRKSRFVQEAKSASALNHPNIVIIHDIATDSGTDFIVMEYVAGKTLDQLIPHKGMRLGEALKIAVQIADALARAHSAGIVHRDLKPANVMVDEHGLVKVLDFGLAKLTEPAPLGDDAATRTQRTQTEEGQIVGTVAYMSPEQAQALPVDARSDVFSFGCVLYEMVTGERAFQGDTKFSTLAAIINQEPGPLPPVVPHDLEKIIARCLRKDLGRRFQHMDDVSVALAELKEESDSGKVVPAVSIRVKPRHRRMILVAGCAAALGLMVAFTAFALFWRARRAPAGGAGLRTEFLQLTSEPGIEWFPSISPDGKWLVYGGEAASGHHIFLRSVGGQNALDLTRGSTDDDDQPAFSPDGEQIAFRSSRGGGGIFVMGRTGEAVRRVTSTGFNPAWSPDGKLLAFTTEKVELHPQNAVQNSELWTVAVDSGELRRVFPGDAVMANWSPHKLRIAFTNRIGYSAQGDVWTVPAAGGEPVRVTSDPARDWNPVWSPDANYLFFASDRGGNMNLWRVPIDEASGKTRGEPEPVTTPAAYLAHPSFSADGRRLAYVSALVTANIQQLALSASGDAKGEPAWVTSGTRRWSNPDPSPDGEWVAFYSLTQPEGQLYIAHPDGSGLRQVTRDATDRMPHWSPDSQWITFFSDRSHNLELWRIRPDGSGLQQLTKSGGGYHAWSPDGSHIATTIPLRREQAAKAKVLIFDPNRTWDEQTPQVLPPLDPPTDSLLVDSWSPDGLRLVGQVSGERGGIVAYSLASQSYERLADFGEWPVWLPDSRRLLFVAEGKAFYIADSRSRQARKIFSVAHDIIGPPRLSRDGSKVFFSRRVTESDIWLCSLR